MNALERLEFGNRVAALMPHEVAGFLKEHGLKVAVIAHYAGITRQNVHLWARGGDTKIRTMERVRTAILCAMEDKRLEPRRALLTRHPDVASDLRWALEKAVQHGDLSERAAAAMLGLNFEEWNTLPPMERP